MSKEYTSWTKSGGAFKESLEKDQMLVVAHFMLGCAHLRQSKDKDALKSFEDAYFFLRGNRLIDYKQLGLKYKLCGCEILCNKAICHARLGNDQQARKDFQRAVETKVDSRPSVIDNIIQCWQNRSPMEPIQLPSHAVFQPSSSKLRAIREKKTNYIGESVVVASGPADHSKGGISESNNKTRGPDSEPPCRPLPQLPKKNGLQANTPPPRPASPLPPKKYEQGSELGRPPSKPLPPSPRSKSPMPGQSLSLPQRSDSTEGLSVRPAPCSHLPPCPSAALRTPDTKEEGTIKFQLVVTRTVQMGKDSSARDLLLAAAKALKLPEDAFSLWYTHNNNLTQVTDDELVSLWKSDSKPTVYCYETNK
ncbi:neutrophil cytosol factor 2 isoform X2 [Nematostella vectensis]|uniref:neutrophil cytosol factor 2 isoform X2 n=1 Tax=Nematostella vectensis TaxID=45351 RepID=UPI00207732E7|nr:neutrophil cytosol factor 2 isoform X2 [Nematostella vectensis]